ncbi:MAG TPA: pyruvate kinase [Armatimonadetes bacterium]|nr:pyruvate kinase [Armatimonadota bacterium]
MRCTKILATLGPATQGREAVRALVSAGANAFRLNFSHGTAAEHEAAVADIRAVEAEHGRPLAILGDLQGPKIRCGRFLDPAGVELVDGQNWQLDKSAEPGDGTRCGVTLPTLLEELPVGTRVLVKDGLVELRVEARGTDALQCRVINGGRVTPGAGLNIPEVDLSVPALDDKDLRDLSLAARLGLDWIALSFVRQPQDMLEARAAMRLLGCKARLMAKIEKPSAVTSFEELLPLCDGVMVARGDLGVELSVQQVPVVQRRLVRRCVEEALPVVVATQMLESMVHNPRPTRAEASDVANAIFDGADVVMLSAETAIGAYPAATVATMASIAETVESSTDFAAQLWRFDDIAEPAIDAAVCHSAARLAQILPARVIAAYTMTGSTARRVARHRPGATIAAYTPALSTARQLQLSWGVRPFVVGPRADHEVLVGEARTRLQEIGLLAPGDAVVVTAGLPIGQAGRTNLLRVERV